jgi:glycosyltransferase involved in cell wall biosynthesis
MRQLRFAIVTDYFPTDAERQVHGVYQRLLRHIASLQRIAAVDLVFLWPRGAGPSGRDFDANLRALRKLWDLRDRIDFVESSFTGQTTLLRLLFPAAFPGTLGRLPPARDAEAGRAIAAIFRQTHPDLILAFRIGAALPVLRQCAGPRPIVVDLDDIEHLRIARDARLAGRSPAALRDLCAAALMRRLEREVAVRASVSLVCSTKDMGLLGRLAPGAVLALLPNAAAASGPLPPAEGATALFVGMAHYRPNADGIVWLAREIWPRVRRALPSARLVIAGDGSDELGVADAGLGIEALGFVPELLPLYRQARIALCPLRSGGGTRIKLIEAAMFGRTCVSTTIGAEGLDFEDGRHLSLADEPDAFARACVALLGDPARAEKMGLAAAELARRLYSEGVVADRLNQICLRALEQSWPSSST